MTLSIPNPLTCPIDDLPAAPPMYSGPDGCEPDDGVEPIVRRADVNTGDGIAWYRTTQHLCRWCRYRYTELTIGPCRYRIAGTVRVVRGRR